MVDRLVAEQRVRIAVPLSTGSVAEVETVWAVPLGDDLYRIDNVPFSAYGLHLDDIVAGVPRTTGITMVRVVTAGGHDTFRVLVWPDVDPIQAQPLLDQLGHIGCGIERATSRWVAIDVPPSVDRDAVVQILDRGWLDHVWRYEDSKEGPPD